MNQTVHHIHVLVPGEYGEAISCVTQLLAVINGKECLYIIAG